MQILIQLCINTIEVNKKFINLKRVYNKKIQFYTIYKILLKLNDALTFKGVDGYSYVVSTLE